VRAGSAGKARRVKILISSHAFAPSIGGIETASALLAEEFSKRDHAVTIVTQTVAKNGEQFPFPIVRQPALSKLFHLISWCDVFWQNNLSLRTLWPALLLRKPVVITHQGSYCRRPSGLDFAQRIKHAVANRMTGVAISKYVAACFKNPSVIIPNPYDAPVFTNKTPTAERSADLIFVGRLVSEKGLDILLESLARLRSRGLHPQLTVVGSGPELTAMQALAHKIDINNQVRFLGAKTGAELAGILNQHKVLVVPSRYDEPFGIVALEGIACGCVVVAAGGGGLPEAIGACGITFPNGDVDALANALEKLLAAPNDLSQFTTSAAQHLARFQPATIADAYLNLFQSKLQ
jgi:glycosyltransferase involved in cell wall biosynthesis